MSSTSVNTGLVAIMRVVDGLLLNVIGIPNSRNGYDNYSRNLLMDSNLNIYV